MKEGYLRLVDMDTTTFDLDGTSYNMETSAPEIFDVWVRQFVEEIKNVDTGSWQLHERWRIVNYLLRCNFLKLEDRKLSREEAGLTTIASSTREKAGNTE